MLCTALAVLATGGVRAQAPTVSTDGADAWYFVTSADTAAAGLLMTDQTDSRPAFPLGLAALSTTNSRAQQWRLVAAGTNGTVRLQNRATGRYVQPASAEAYLYRVAQTGSAVIEGRGFALTALGSEQYALSGSEADSTVRYLIAAREGVAPALAAGATVGSMFAWTFELAEPVGISTTREAQPRISVQGGRVSCSPQVPLRIVTTTGVEVPASQPLRAGIYLVTPRGAKTQKIIVKP